MLDTVIGKYKVGSLLNVPLSVAQKKEKWAEAIKQIQDLSMKEIGIPVSMVSTRFTELPIHSMEPCSRKASIWEQLSIVN